MDKITWEDALNNIQNKKNKNKVFFIFFTLPNFSNVEVMKKVIIQLSNDFIDNKNVIFYEIDANEAKLYLTLESRFKVFQIPCYTVIKNDFIFYNGYNFYPKEILKDWILELLD
ncbi:Uncharacterised protein [Mycoplasmopsis maculosa]|uniref:Thioredoxin n=1 Tax=Mycoplasmopsis maculosa TaxID=114885 RepID=A0A449B3P0_9BACT|nr:thioredoxin [Mycoplasmopsis maculosa]VEU75185.1 Uncharacterised protein [Mycoplasmopsis maculosa]